MGLYLLPNDIDPTRHNFCFRRANLPDVYVWNAKDLTASPVGMSKAHIVAGYPASVVRDLLRSGKWVVVGRCYV